MGHLMERIFVGREKELAIMSQLFDMPGPKTLAILGRRRIGKSSLLRKFSEDKRTLSFTFFEDDGIESSLLLMRKVMSAFGGEDVGGFENLLDAFDMIKRICSEERTVVILDEFPYLAAQCKAAPSMLQQFVDRELDGTDTLVIVCGSSVAMMQEHLDNIQRPLYGRFSRRIDLGPLSLDECRAFHKGMSDDDLMRVYLTIGGVPYYHELMIGDTYEECVKRAFLDRMGPLYGEAEKTVLQELRPVSVFSELLSSIADGKTVQTEIASKANISPVSCSQYLRRMMDLGLIEEVHPMLRMGKKAGFRISDNLLAFWFEIVRNHKLEISQDRSDTLYQMILPDISTFLGKRFEMVVEQYIMDSYLVKEMGKWIGHSLGESTDIDIVAKVYDEHRVVMNLVCECKFRSKPATMADLEELRESSKDAGCIENVRYMIASWGGFKNNLIEEAEDRDDLFLVGREKIMGSEPADPLMGKDYIEGELEL